MDKKQLTLQLGKNIAYYRKRSGIKLNDLAVRLQVSPAFLSRVEHGEKMPSTYLLYLLANELCMSCDTLICGPDGQAHTRNILALLQGKSQEELDRLEKLICVWNEGTRN